MLLWIALCYLSFNFAFCSFNLPIEFPNPQQEWRMCGKNKPSYVCDPEFILDRGEEEKLDKLIQELKISSLCMCSSCPEDTGIQIGIFVRNNLTEETASEKNGQELAENIRQKWQLGTCEDDIIIILLTQANISGFSLGPSIKNILTEETAAKILADCQIHFYSGYFYQGLESIVNSFHDVITREQKTDSESYNELLIGLLIGFAILLVIVSCVLAVRFRQRKRRKKSCSNVYENDSSNQDRKHLPNDQKEQLEKLNQRSDGEIEDDV